jgi:hypothetical protein
MMRWFRPILAYAALGVASTPVAFAETVRLSAGGLTFAVPEGWAQGKEPGFAHYIEPSLEDEDWSRCAIKVQAGPNPRELTQDEFNETLGMRRAADLLEPDEKLSHFSNSTYVGGVRVLAYGFTSGGTAFEVRTYAVVDGKSFHAVQADCVSPNEQDKKFWNAANAFFASAKIASR